MLSVYVPLSEDMLLSLADEIVENIKWLGVDNILLLTKNTKGKVFYPSGIAPSRSTGLFEAIIDKAGDEGIEVNAWLCLFEEDMHDVNPIVKEHPDILLVNRYGKSNWEQPTWSDMDTKYSTFWVCPSSQVYLDYLGRIIEELVRYKLRGIHMDYVRYPEAVEGRYYCYCHRCLRKFREQYGYKFPTREVIHIRYYVSILTENVTNAVKALSDKARAHGLHSSAYVFTDYVTAIEACYQDWPAFSRYLDYLIPTLYEVSPSHARRLVSRAVDVTPEGLPIIPAVYANRMVRRAVKGVERWTTKRGADYIAELAKASLEAGAKGIALFNYATMFNQSLPMSLRKEDLVELRKKLAEIGLAQL